MNYEETVEWMFSRLPMYQQQGASAYKKDLSNIVLLCDYLNNPQKKIKCIHVGGTNGKGSTSHILASILQESGYKTGLYTSPHLKDFRERIRINGIMIPKEEVVSFIESHRHFFEDNDLSFFEMTVGLCFWYLAKEKVDFAIIEVGLGGRLDATNIITPILSVITNIGLDHTQFLGNTLELIAFEKAGIIKTEIPVVIGETTNETLKVFESVANEKNSKLILAEENPFTNYDSDLKGDYQKQNKRTVIAAIDELRTIGLTIPESAIVNGLNKVTENTGLHGRWQILGHNPTIIADTAHNAHGLNIALNQLLHTTHEHLHIVLGVVNDKDLDSVLPLFPKNATYYFAKPDLPRGLDANILAEKANSFGLSGETYNSVIEAYSIAKQHAKPKDVIYIGGSTFVIAEIL